MRSFILAAGALGAAALLAGPARAAIITYEFEINVEQATPVPDVDGFNPSGFGIVNIDTDLMTIEWNVTYEGLTGPIVAPGAHFHGPALPGETAGVEIFLSTGDPAEPASGTLFGSAPLSMQQLSDVTSGLWYVNIHTAQNPAGEIRGQVVPAPGAIALLGLAGINARGRRRRV
jgi:hypothetical protein